MLILISKFSQSVLQQELKDENARVYKLLSEKDFEVRQIKKKNENQARGTDIQYSSITRFYGRIFLKRQNLS